MKDKYTEMFESMLEEKPKPKKEMISDTVLYSIKDLISNNKKEFEGVIRELGYEDVGFMKISNIKLHKDKSVAVITIKTEDQTFNIELTAKNK